MGNMVFSAPWRRWLSVMLALISAIALSSCSPAQHKTQAAQIPQLVVATLSDPKTFNYALSSESPNVFGYIYEGLVAENGLTGVIEPALAQQWEISPDKRQIVFTLREGLKWSDGEPLTADDVVFTYNDIYFNEAIPTPIEIA
jgi:peptide/nickel transport system substrate-binding protein